MSLLCCVLKYFCTLLTWRPVVVFYVTLLEHNAGRSSLVVACLTAVWGDPGSNITAGSCVYHDSHCLGAGCTHLLYSHMSTQPSILRGTVKWVSAFGLSNTNKWRWWVTLRPSRLARLPTAWRRVCIYQMNRVNSSNSLAMMTAPWALSLV